MESLESYTESLEGYTVCQTACNDEAFACINDADVYFETVAAGIDVLRTLLGCNSRMSACLHDCTVEFFPELAFLTGAALPVVVAGGIVAAAMWGLGLVDGLPALVVGGITIAATLWGMGLAFDDPSKPNSNFSGSSRSSVTPYDSSNSSNSGFHGPVTWGFDGPPPYSSRSKNKNNSTTKSYNPDSNKSSTIQHSEF